MRLRRPTQTPPPENVLPMINVVFLLLVFFMLAGALQSADLFEIDPVTSRSETSVERTQTAVLVDRQGRLALEGREVDRDELRSVLAERLADRPEMIVHIKADRRVPTPRVIDVMELLREAGIARVTLLALEGAA